MGILNISGRTCARHAGLRAALLLLLCAGLSSCASTAQTSRVDADADFAESGVSDPLENINRGTLAVNDVIDRGVLEPVARGYRAATPKEIRFGVRNFLRNLKSPIVIANQALQGDIEGTGTAVFRFVVNTLAGFGGILDVAADEGIAYEPEDFGQTLAVWGVGNGPYLVLPLFGPSTVRDGAGLVVDSFADPVRIYLFNTENEGWHYGRIAASVIDQREELLDVLDDLRQNSFDYYAALRSTYIQRRVALVRDEDPESSGSPEIPDYGR